MKAILKRTKKPIILAIAVLGIFTFIFAFGFIPAHMWWIWLPLFLGYLGYMYFHDQEGYLPSWKDKVKEILGFFGALLLFLAILVIIGSCLASFP